MHLYNGKPYSNYSQGKQGCQVGFIYLFIFFQLIIRSEIKNNKIFWFDKSGQLTKKDNLSTLMGMNQINDKVQMSFIAFQRKVQ